jgi:hypothetical protein
MKQLDVGGSHFPRFNCILTILGRGPQTRVLNGLEITFMDGGEPSVANNVESGD